MAHEWKLDDKTQKPTEPCKRCGGEYADLLVVRRLDCVGAHPHAPSPNPSQQGRCHGCGKKL